MASLIGDKGVVKKTIYCISTATRKRDQPKKANLLILLAVPTGLEPVSSA